MRSFEYFRFETRKSKKEIENLKKMQEKFNIKDASKISFKLRNGSFR